jgi:outer membrane receptor protein involved in Fe transport
MPLTPTIAVLRSAPRARLALSILFALSAMPAFAQQSESADDDGARELDTVTVTAQRREEDAQEVPVAITTVSAEKLDVLGSGGEDIRFLSGRLPSLLIESSFGRTFPRFYVRGLGNTDFDLNASQPVSLVYDDVVQENPMLKGFPVFDLDQIELLRGPQGTLFGRNSPAGVVKFESAKPTQETEGYAQINYGSYGTANFEGAVGGALSEAWSARVATLLQHRDDWVDNTFTGENDALEGYDDFAGRVQFLYDGGNDFTALFNLHARSYEGSARLFRANIIAPGTNQLVGGFDRDSISIDGDNHSELDSHGASARLSWDLGRVSLHSITGYETARHLQPRRHRRRFRRGLPAGVGPGLRAVPGGIGRRPARARPVVAGSSASNRTNGARWTGRPACTGSTKASSSTASTTTPWPAGSRTATRADPGQHRLGAVRIGDYDGDRRLQAARRPALHPRREGLHRATLRSLADRRRHRWRRCWWRVRTTPTSAGISRACGRCRMT